jgi:imidazole glycerol-phosphate synthase subunit HisH
MIVILDYGMGNVKSISNMLTKIGVENSITSDVSKINDADKYILPGVGSFDEGMSRICKSGWLVALEHNVLELKKPILGICLGMQLLTKRSEEGSSAGLSWINAKVVKFKNSDLMVPHMGWNTIKTADSSLFDNLTNSRFYFVHSFYVPVSGKNNIIAKTKYGIDFGCAIQNENIYGVQFHPEKSHKFGMQFLKNFNNI